VNVATGPAPGEVAVALHGVAGGVKLVVERDVDARREPLVRGRPHREREVRGGVAGGLVEASLRAGDDDRRVEVGEQVQRERGVREGVRPVRDDDAVRALPRGLVSLAGVSRSLADRVARGCRGREYVLPPDVEPGL